MANAFAGAETQIDKEKMSALNALASFGRSGLEQAVTAKQQAKSSSLSLVNGIGKAQSNAFVRDASEAEKFLKTEQNIAGRVNSNYFNQARQAVPGLRANATAVEDEYRAAYQERQAAVAAQAARDKELRQQALLQQQAIRQQMAQSAEMARLAQAAEQERAARASPAAQAANERIRAATIAAMSAAQIKGWAGSQPSAGFARLRDLGKKKASPVRRPTRAGVPF